MSDQYEVVWTGATHRQFPTMSIPATERAQVERAAAKLPSGRRKVLNALGTAWTSGAGIVGRSGLARNTVDIWLNRLISDGLVERLTVGATGRGGQPQKLYRRKADA